MAYLFRALVFLGVIIASKLKHILECKTVHVTITIYVRGEKLIKSQFVFSSFPAAQCLTCSLCTIGISGACLIGGNVTCDSQTSSCFSGTASKLIPTDWTVNTYLKA